MRNKTASLNVARYGMGVAAYGDHIYGVSGTNASVPLTGVEYLKTTPHLKFLSFMLR